MDVLLAGGKETSTPFNCCKYHRLLSNFHNFSISFSVCLKYSVIRYSLV